MNMIIDSVGCVDPHCCPSWDDNDCPPPKDDFLDEIIEEIATYNEDFARSNEDGWFYSDQESGINAIPDRSGDED